MGFDRENGQFVEAAIGATALTGERQGQTSNYFSNGPIDVVMEFPNGFQSRIVALGGTHL